MLFFINPQLTSVLGFALLYLSLFFALTGTLSLLGYLFRWLFTRKYSKSDEVTISFRQAVFFALVFTGSLFLQGNRLLTWVNALVLVALVTALEFLFVSLKRNYFNSVNPPEKHEGNL